jgi:hypothetical protein
MKKIAVFVVVLLVAVIVLGSCNRQTCPAYSKADASRTERNG